MNDTAEHPAVPETDPGGPIQVTGPVEGVGIAIGHGARVEIAGDVVYQGPRYARLQYRQEIEDLLLLYGATFVGREGEVARIASLAGQERAGYLLIEALPGFGKSALAAQLIHRLDNGEWPASPAPALVPIFVRQEGKRNSPVAFLQALNSQLLDLLQLPGGVPPELTALKSQFSELWAGALQSAGPERPLLLLVDGLDEMAGGEETIAHLLPRALAPYVHVVVSSRPEPDPLSAVALEHPFRQADKLELPELSKQDVRSVLLVSGLAEAGAAQLSPRVWAATQGEPLFVRFLSQEVVDQGQAALERLEMDPPAGVEEYFRRQFRQLDQVAEAELTWQILGLLVAATGGITLEELAELTGVPKRRVRKALEPIRRFLLGRQRLSLMHEQLRRVLAGEFSQTESKTYQALFLTWGRRYQEIGWPEHTPDYLAANYMLHLMEAGDNERIYALLDRPWMRLLFRKSHAHRAFAEDLSRAISLARGESPPNLDQVFRCSLIYATLGALASNAPPAVLGVLARTGQASRAESYASLVSDRQKQAEAYLQIAMAHLAAGENARAQALFEQALAAGEAIDFGQARMKILSRVRDGMAALGANEQVATITTAADTYWESELQAALARFDQEEQQSDKWYAALGLQRAMEPLLDAGKEAMAAELAERLAAFAEAVADRGIFDGNRSLKPQTVEWLAWAAQRLALAGRTGRASEVVRMGMARAKQLDEPYAQVQPMTALAEAVALAGDLDQAIALAKSIRLAWPESDDKGSLDSTDRELEINRQHRASALRSVARTLSKAGRHGLAMRVVPHLFAAMKGLDGKWLRMTLSLDLASIHLAAGRNDRAAELADESAALAIELDEQRDLTTARREAAVALARSGKAGIAQERAQSIRDHWDRTAALGDVAQGLLERGDVDAACYLADRVLAMSDGELDEGYHGYARAGIARALAGAEAFARAIRTADSITEPGPRAQALVEIALALALAGDLSSAAEYAAKVGELLDGLERPENHPRTLDLLAHVYAARGDFAETMTTAKRIAARWNRAAAFSSLAIFFDERGQADEAALFLDEAVTIAGEEHSDWYLDWVLAPVIRALALAGRIDEALALAGRLESERSITQAMGAIVYGMVKHGLNERAKKLVAESEKPVERMSLQGSLALALLETGEEHEGLEWLKKVEEAAGEFADPAYESWALGIVASGHARYGRPGEAVELNRRIQQLVEAGPQDKGAAAFWADLAARYQEAGDQDGAVESLTAMLDAARRSGRQEFLIQLERSANLFAALDEGESLWKMAQTMSQIDEWWRLVPREG